MILVTGGAGFIGSNLAAALNDRGHRDVVVVDHLARGDKFRNLRGLAVADYRDREDFFQELREGAWNHVPIRAIFHQGACADTLESDGRYMMQNNFEYSKALLHFALERRIPLIYASSASVYGLGKRGFSEEPENEFPLNVYAYSKHLFDAYVRRLLPSAESPVVGLRYFNVFGPQEMHKGPMASMVYQAFLQLETTGTVRLFGAAEGFDAGEQRRDFVAVGDVARVNLFFLDHPEVSGIFNCGTGQARSFNDVARQLIALRGSGTITYVPFPPELTGKYQNHTQADLGALRRVGCDVVFPSLEESLEAYVRLLRRQEGFLATP